MRNLNPINNVNDREVVERTFVYGSLLSIITGKNAKGYNILHSFGKNKNALQLYKNSIEVKDDRKAVLEFIKVVDVKKKVE